jgi:hypothetical protein
MSKKIHKFLYSAGTRKKLQKKVSGTRKPPKLSWDQKKAQKGPGSEKKQLGPENNLSHVKLDLIIIIRRDML